MYMESKHTMEKKFNLCEIFPLDAMHDQRITRSELSAGKLPFYFEDLQFSEPDSPEAASYYNKHKDYHVCVLTFSELEEADLFVELRRKTQSGIEIIEYYDNEWIQFLQSHHFSVEVSGFYCGYRCVIICGAIVAQTGHYGEDCIIKVSADTVVYQWYT